MRCPVTNNCVMTTNRSLLASYEDYNAFLFFMRGIRELEKDFLDSRTPRQRYIAYKARVGYYEFPEVLRGECLEKTRLLRQ